MQEKWPDSVRNQFETYLGRGATVTEARKLLLDDHKVTLPKSTAKGMKHAWERKKVANGRLEAIRGCTPVIAENTSNMMRFPTINHDLQIDTSKLETPKILSIDSIVLVIPDLHCPWEHENALAFLKAVKAKYQPTTIVNLGDEVDFYGMSRFDHGPDMPSPGNELSLAVKHLIPFYREFPNSLVCQSNHTHRVHAKAKKAGMPSGTIKSIEEILHCPEGWIYKRAHKVDGVVYKHGTGKSGPNAHINHAKAISQSCAIGHIHAYGGVNYLKPGMFAANFACLIDKYAECFSYAEEMDDNIVLGCGIVKNGMEAHFIPMHVDADNRWVGTL